MNFGYRLRHLRISKQISQKDLANALSLSSNTISQYETNKRFPDQKGFINLCRFFNVSADYLLCLSDIPFPSVIRSDTENKNQSLSADQLAAINDLLKAFNKN